MINFETTLKLLYNLKNNKYNKDNLRQSLEAAEQTADLEDVYTRNILKNISIENKEKFLHTIQQKIKEVQESSQKIAMHLTELLPKNSSILLPTISPFVIQVVQQLDRHTIYIPENIPQTTITSLSNKHNVITTSTSQNSDFDVSILPCSFNEKSINTDIKIYNKVKNNKILFISPIHNHTNKKGKIFNGKIVTEKGCYSHQSLIEEFKNLISSSSS